jgi:membrane-bound lytic murein transglycosylase D
MDRSQLRRRALIALSLLAVASAFSLEARAIEGSQAQGAHLQISTPSPSTSISNAGQGVTPPTDAPVEDPVLTLIATSDRHFQAGRSAFEQGSVETAKQAFDRAVNVVLESAYGSRTEPRIREHFDRLVERIGTFDRKPPLEGELTERKPDPAVADPLAAAAVAAATPQVPADAKSTTPSDGQPPEPAIAVPLNQRVLAYIDLFQGRLREFIEEGMKRGSKYMPMIQSVFRAEGLPLDLAYVPLVESAFKPTAQSRKKAKGVWQFMGRTASANGLRRDLYVDERSDVQKATVAAAKYFGTLGKLFDGDWHLALASYNGGPGRLQRAMKRTGQDDFWKLSKKPKALPRETREYVPMILAAIVIARNPSQYGFEFVPEAAPDYETVTLSRPVDLRHVAEWTDASPDEMKALNPELLRWTTPIKDEAYDLRVPAGTAAVVEARLAEASGPEGGLRWYTVKRGDTLLQISKKLGVKRADLAKANYLLTTSPVTAGQRLLLPQEATLVKAAAETERPVSMAEARATTGSATAEPDRATISYKVKAGDTLTSIARIFSTSVSSLRTWNKLSGSTIHPGTRLTIYGTRN